MMANRLPPLQTNMAAFGNGRLPENQVDIPSRGNSRMMIERASDLKDSIVAHMLEDDRYPGMMQDRHMRGLLREHLYTVTSALTKLGHDIESLESQINGRDQASAMSNTMMRSIEVQQATSVNDLRSRVARCDANISVVSSDMRKLFDSLSALTLQMQNVMGHQTRSDRLFEEKISQLSENNDRSRSDYSTRLHSSEEKFQMALGVLDTRLKNLIDETGRTVDSIRLQGESSQVKLEREMTMTMESAKERRDRKLDEVEQSVLKKISALEKRMDQLELEQSDTKNSLSAELQDIRLAFESSLQNEQKRLERRLRTSVNEIRQESSGGLKSLGESLTSLRAVLEGKQTLLAEEIRGEMSRMKKLVVVT